MAKVAGAFLSSDSMNFHIHCKSGVAVAEIFLQLFAQGTSPVNFSHVQLDRELESSLPPAAMESGILRGGICTAINCAIADRRPLPRCHSGLGTTTFGETHELFAGTIIPNLSIS